MTRFLIATIPAAGHVNPALPIARQLVEYGNEVWWYTGKGFREKVEATGAHHVPIKTGLDFTDMSTIPPFEYPRSDLPPQVHFIGPFLPKLSADFTPPTWWKDLEGNRPIVFVTQGTVATDAGDLIMPAIQALADEDVLVVVTTGGQQIEKLKIEPLPANVRVELFIPYDHLLPHVDVMVTNAGFNGVQLALANGIPLVTAGQTEEKPEICARVQWTGVGIDLKTSTPTPMQVRNAVMKILSYSQYRQRAKQFQAEIASYDTPALVRKLLEQLAATKQPVLRTERGS